MFLSDLKIGEEKTVVKLNNCEKTKIRLNNMGLCEGVRVKLIRNSPLNDPIQIKVRDFYMAIRLSQAKKIVVE